MVGFQSREQVRRDLVWRPAAGVDVCTVQGAGSACGAQVLRSAHITYRGFDIGFDIRYTWPRHRAAGGFVIEFGGVCYQDTYPDVS